MPSATSSTPTITYGRSGGADGNVPSFLVYPDGRPTFWHFLQGKLRRVTVRARLLPIPAHLVGADYSGDAAVRAAFQAWVQQLWREKEAQITELAAGT